MKKTSLFAYVLPFIAVSAMASFTPLSKQLLSTMHPIHLMFYVQAISLFLFLIVLGLVPEIKKTVKQCNRCTLSFFIFVVLNGVVAPWLLLFGLRVTSALNAALLANMYSIFLIAYSFIFYKERITWMRGLGIIVILFGSLFIILGEKSLAVTLNYGDLLIILSQFFWATGDFINKNYLYKIHADVLILGKLLFTVPFFLLLSIIILPLQPLTLTSGSLDSLLALALFPVLLGTLIWYRSLRVSSSVSLSIANFTYPLFGVFLAWAILGEQFTNFHLIGSVAIIAGLIITQIQPLIIHRLHHTRHLHNVHALQRDIPKP